MERQIEVNGYYKERDMEEYDEEVKEIEEIVDVRNRKENKMLQMVLFERL